MMVTDKRPCRDFMWAVLDGFSLDREGSGLTGYDDAQIQDMMTDWMKDPDSERECAFYKLVLLCFLLDL